MTGTGVVVVGVVSVVALVTALVLDLLWRAAAIGRHPWERALTWTTVVSGSVVAVCFGLRIWQFVT